MEEQLLLIFRFYLQLLDFQNKVLDRALHIHRTSFRHSLDSYITQVQVFHDLDHSHSSIYMQFYHLDVSRLLQLLVFQIFVRPNQMYQAV